MIFEDPAGHDALNCFSCRSRGTVAKTKHRYVKEHDIRVCMVCKNTLEEEREVLPGITSSWFDVKWVEDAHAATQWQDLGASIAQANNDAGDSVRQVLGSRSTYPYREVIITSPYQPGLLSGSDVVTLERLQHRLQQEEVMEAGFLPFHDSGSEEMHDHLAKKCFEVSALFNRRIWDLGTEAHLFRSKSGKPLREGTTAEDLEEVFAPLRPTSELEHPGLGVTVSVELSNVYKDDGVVIPIAIYCQNPLEAIPDHRKRQMLGDLALQALYHDVDEGCLVLFSQPEGEPDGPFFAVLRVQGLRNYLLGTTEQWFESTPELHSQLARFTLRTASNPLHSAWQEGHL
jgi:hypothetical protein